MSEVIASSSSEPRLRVTILGCGSSGGVPRVGMEWGRCNPDDPRNVRTRCSLLIERYVGTYDPHSSTCVLIDTSPDLRTQLLGAKITHIDGLLYTHDHADQSHGIDDLRALVYQNRKPIPTWMDAVTSASLRARFGYIFETPEGSHYPALLDAKAMQAFGETVRVDGEGGPIDLQVLAQNHGEIDSLGFRFGPFAYCNDCKILPDASLSACIGAEVFIVDALRYLPHPSHAHLEQSLAWIAAVAPQQAILTNLHIDMDFEELSAQLPPHIVPAIDGMVIDLPA